MFKRLQLAAVAVLATVASAPAFAIVATDLDPIGAEITSTVGVLMPWALTMIAVVLGGSIALGLVKKFGRKAGS